MKIGLENSFCNNYKKLGDLTWNSNKLLYSKIHKYFNYLNIYSNKSTIWHGYHKIINTKNILEKEKIDWIWVTGCDSMVTNFEKPISDYIDDKYEIIIAKDQNAINIDSFLIKNSKKSIEILNTILERYNKYVNKLWKENQCLIDLYNSGEYKDNIKIVPQRWFNAYDYNLYGWLPKPNLDGLGLDGNWQPGDLLIHWPALSLDRRVELFNKYSKS